MISAIAAVSYKTRAIGKDKRLLWSIPEDLKRFRGLTIDHPVIMGRGTMEHIMLTTGKAMVRRTNIVVSRNTDLKVPDGFTLVPSFDAAVELARRSPGGQEEVFVMGGAQLWTSELPKIDRLYLTIIKDEKPADAFFPDYSEFTKVVEKSEPMKFGEISYYYLTLERP